MNLLSWFVALGLCVSVSQLGESVESELLPTGSLMLNAHVIASGGGRTFSAPSILCELCSLSSSIGQPLAGSSFAAPDWSQISGFLGAVESGLLFYDGFESGDLVAWDLVNTGSGIFAGGSPK